VIAALVTGAPFWNAVVGGIATGSIYALVAYGYSLVFLSTNVFNFAQGDLVTLGAIAGYTVLVTWGSPAVIALAGAIAIAAAVGAGEWFVFVAPVVRRAETLAWLVTTLAFSIILRNILIQEGWGGDKFRTFDWPFGHGEIHIGQIVIPPAYIGAVVTAIGVAVALQLVYGRTLFGKAMLAIAEDREAARMRGISVFRYAAISFGVGGALAGLAGFIIAPSSFVSSSLGQNLGLKSFVALALGGFTNPQGALFGGILYGLVEAQAGLYISAAWVDAVGLGLLVAVLALFPNGLVRGVQTRTL
jgi:branched-chain amino acid transport system permease protein